MPENKQLNNKLCVTIKQIMFIFHASEKPTILKTNLEEGNFINISR